jgi:hypothetical protein
MYVCVWCAFQPEMPRTLPQACAWISAPRQHLVQRAQNSSSTPLHAKCRRASLCATSSWKISAQMNLKTFRSTLPSVSVISNSSPTPCAGARWQPRLGLTTASLATSSTVCSAIDQDVPELGSPHQGTLRSAVRGQVGQANGGRSGRTRTHRGQPASPERLLLPLRATRVQSNGKVEWQSTTAK